MKFRQARRQFLKVMGLSVVSMTASKLLSANNNQTQIGVLGCSAITLSFVKKRQISELSL